MTAEIKTADLARITERVQKLLNLAAKNPNQAEAEAATAKAMAMLEAYNLDMSTLEQGGSDGGAREDSRQRGGMYTYERELWSGIAEINFCMYFTLRHYDYDRRTRSGSPRLTFQHRFVGRKVNVTSTKIMGQYVQGTIERLCRERFPANNQFFCSEAVAYREGMADEVRRKLWRRRQEQLRDAEAQEAVVEEARRRAEEAGVSLSTALTIADVVKSEEEANYDFLHGEGSFARRKKEREDWQREAAEDRAAQAAAEAEAEAEYTRWAAEHPEEAAREEKKRLARERAEERKEARRTGPRYRSETAEERRRGSSYYRAGRQAGEGISIDPQAGGTSKTRALR